MMEVTGITIVAGNVTQTGAETLTNKTLTLPKINEDVAVTSTATELNLLDGVSGLVQADLTKLAAIDATAAEIDTLDALSRGSIIYGNASAATAILTKGSANTVLTSDGTDIAWSAVDAGVAWQSSIVTASTITVVAGRAYWINTTSNACTITLPSSASVGDQLIFTDYARTWGTNAVTINQNGLKFQGGTDNPVYDTLGQSVDLVYSGATKGWIPNSDDVVANEGVIPTFDVALNPGGGSGGGSNAGGGGAGGFLHNYGATAIALRQGTVNIIIISSRFIAGADGSNSIAFFMYALQQLLLSVEVVVVMVIMLVEWWFRWW